VIYKEVKSLQPHIAQKTWLVAVFLTQIRIKLRLLDPATDPKCGSGSGSTCLSTSLKNQKLLRAMTGQLKKNFLFLFVLIHDYIYSQLGIINSKVTAFNVNRYQLCKC
jgi:hypothetical protein